MFARGSPGDKENLNFFIDSGLVSLHPDGKGELCQAAFATAAELYKELGLPEELVQKRVFDSDRALRLGALSQQGHLLTVTENPIWKECRGVRIHGLLSPAWLQRYARTLDLSFDLTQGQDDIKIWKEFVTILNNNT